MKSLPIFVPERTVEFSGIMFLEGQHPAKPESRVIVLPARVLGPCMEQCSYGERDLARTLEEAVERLMLMYPYWCVKATIQKWGHN